MKYKYVSDCHSHSDCSFDAESSMFDMCTRAQELGLTHYTITDHCECEQYLYSGYFDGKRYCDCVKASYEQLLENQQRFPNLLRGLEIGQPLQNLAAVEDALNGRTYDFIIGSLHAVAGWDDFYFLNPTSFTEEEKERVFHAYFKEIMDMLDWGHFDTLAHITYPLRYLCNPGEKPSFARYQDELDAVLKKVIEKDKALEFNTSRILRTDSPILPDRAVYTRYKELGGWRVTLGADAHTTENVASGITQAMDLLSDIGFKEYTVYIGRKPHQIPIELNTEEKE